MLLIGHAALRQFCGKPYIIRPHQGAQKARIFKYTHLAPQYRATHGLGESGAHRLVAQLTLGNPRRISSASARGIQTKAEK